MATILNIKGIKIGDKLTFNYGGTFPTKVGTVYDIVASRSSKHGAFAAVELSKETDEIGNSFRKVTTVELGHIMSPGETTVNGSPIGVFTT